jgi:hypothetical protein
MTAQPRQRKPDPRRLGPHSRMLSRGTISGRSREGRYIKTVSAQLTEHIGGSPSAAQRMLIARLARVMLRLELFDEKMAAGKPFTDLDGRIYNSLLNSFRLLLREVGIRAAPAPTKSLAEIIAAEAERGDPGYDLGEADSPEAA